MPTPFQAVRLTPALIALAVALPAAAETPQPPCGAWSFAGTTLVECANPNDSPGPFTPPTLVSIQQDSAGVTALLDDGTVIDLDQAANGTIIYVVDGNEVDGEFVEDLLATSLTDDERAAVSDVVAAESTSEAADELVILLAD
jgi:hypothetical protein